MIVCEPATRWAVLLRRLTPDLPLSEVRSLVLADDLVRASPASFVAIAASELNAGNALQHLDRWRRDFPLSASAVLLDAPMPALELGFREAGAQLVVRGLFELPLVICMAQRHLAQVKAPAME